MDYITLESVQLELTKVEMVEQQLPSILKSIAFNISATEYRVLAHIYVYGRDGLTILANEGTMTMKSLENITTKYRKLGLVHGLRNNTKLHPEIQPKLESYKFETIVTLKNE